MSSDASQDLMITAEEEELLKTMIANDDCWDEALGGNCVSDEIDPEEEALILSTNDECCGLSSMKESVSDEKPMSPLLPERSDLLDTVDVEEETLMKIVNANDECCGLAPMESSVSDPLLSEQSCSDGVSTEEEALMNIVNINDECCGLAPTDDSERSATEITSETNTEELSKNNDDEDDGVDITIGSIEASADNLPEEPCTDPTNHFTSAWLKIMHMVDPGNTGKPGLIDVYSIDLSSIDSEDKPWTKPGVNLSKYFNYSFTEESWLRHCKKRKENIEQATPQQNISTADAVVTVPPVDTANAIQSQDQPPSDCVPVLKQNVPSVAKNAQDVKISNGGSNERNNMPDVKENSKSGSPSKPKSNLENIREETRKVKVQESEQKGKSLKRERDHSLENKQKKRKKSNRTNVEQFNTIFYEQPERPNFDEYRTHGDKRLISSHHHGEFHGIDRRDGFERRERSHDRSDRYREPRGDFDRNSNYYAREFNTETRVHNMIDGNLYSNESHRHFNRNRHDESHRSRHNERERRW